MNIDGHVHFWRPALGYDILILRREERLRRDALPDDLAPLVRAAGVDAAVTVQAAPDVAETLFQLELAARTPWIIGVVGWVDLTSPDLGATLDRLQRHRTFRGVRAMLHRIEDPEWIARPDVGHGLAELERRGLSLDLIARPPHLRACRRSLARVPGLRTVIDHGGGPPIADRGWQPWADGIAAIAGETTAFCKFSGLLEEARPADGEAELLPYVEHLVATFGVERLVFSSNWPVCDLVGGYARWHAFALSLATRLGLSPARLLGANARRLYAIADSGEGADGIGA